MDARLGEPSLGPLSRLRYFKYELAAFRGVQDQQWEVLDKMIYDLYRFDADQGNRNPRSGKHWLTNVKGEHKYNGVLRVVAGCFETMNAQDDLVSEWDAEINHIRDEVRSAPVPRFIVHSHATSTVSSPTGRSPGLARECGSSLYRRHRALPAVVLCGQRLWHEHIRCKRYAYDPVGVLGICNTVHGLGGRTSTLLGGCAPSEEMVDAQKRNRRPLNGANVITVCEVGVLDRWMLGSADGVCFG